ncbi:hypothetical protein HDV05_001341 [Chytridiales sp. JEL 0842]|nr:hypothetical protein HDV05_001341 [Chytridiales sp. JEL 0842]
MASISLLVQPADKNDISAWMHFLEAKEKTEARKTLRDLYTEATQSISADKLKSDTRLLDIWLKYLHFEIEAKESPSEIRDKFKFLKSRCGGTSAALYLHWAQFENKIGNADRAKTILKTGIAKGVKPKVDLEDALQRMEADVEVEQPQLLQLSASSPKESISSSPTSSTSSTSSPRLENLAPRIVSLPSSGLSNSQQQNTEKPASSSESRNVNQTTLASSTPIQYANRNFQPAVSSTPLNPVNRNIPLAMSSTRNYPLNRDVQPGISLTPLYQDSRNLPPAISSTPSTQPNRISRPTTSNTTSEPCIRRALQEIKSQSVSNTPMNLPDKFATQRDQLEMMKKTANVEKDKQDAAINATRKTDEKMLYVPQSKVTLETKSASKPIVEPAPHEKPIIPPSMKQSQQTTDKFKEKSNKIFVSVNGVLYRKIELIGKGASSKVYKVISEEGRIYALKKVKLDDEDETQVEGYLNEIELLRKLEKSPHIINLIDAEVNQEESCILMVLEFGEIDLAHLLMKDESKVRDLNFVRLYWKQMLQAVQSIHEQKIIHSDLKPANFLLVEGSLKLIDFGIAKSIPTDKTSVHRECQTGTINYMAPEALVFSDVESPEGRLKLGRPSDIWSLGCILYQMVFGRPPFAHLSMLQKLQCISDPSYAISYPEDADPLLLEVLKGCLDRNLKKRWTIPELLGHGFLHPEAVAKSGAAAAIPPTLQSEDAATYNVKLNSAAMIAEDPVIEAFVNNIMKDGKKTVARRIISQTLQHLQTTLNQNPRVVLAQAVEQVEPLFKVVGIKRGAKSIQTPKPLNERQRRRTAILWIVEAANKRHKKDSMGLRIAKEVLDVLEGESSALGKKAQVHKAALVNRSNVVLMDRKVMRFS